MYVLVYTPTLYGFKVGSEPPDISSVKVLRKFSLVPAQKSNPEPPA